MKSSRLIPLMIATALAATMLTTGCKKENSTEENDDFATEGTELGQAEDVSNDIDNSVAEAFSLNGNGTIGGRLGSSENSELSNCATVTVDSINSTITIDFDHCIGPHGHYRDGQIIIHHQNGGYWDVGASWDMTFNDFYIDDKQVTGTRHVENMGPASNGMTWNITSSLTFTRTSDGAYRTWQSTRTRELMQGYNDNTIVKIYKINGTASSFNSRSNSTANLVFTNLIRPMDCHFLTSGTIDITRSGRPDIAIDFGNGTCDDLATVTKNGVSRTIHLRGPHH